MHEMSIARSVIDIVRQHLPAGDASPVRTVRLRLGRMSGVVPASLEFCFGALASGTRIDGASLVIEESPVTARCGECGTVSEMPFPFAECPACRSTRMTMESGMELQVVDIETGDERGGR